MFDNGNYDTFIDNCVKLNSNNFMTIPRSNKNVLFNYNIRSYHRNSDEFFGIMQQFGTMPDIFCLTETWFNEQTQADIDGYNSFHAFREQRNGGGTSIFVKSKYDAALMSETTFVSDVLEVCTVKAKVCGNNIIIISIYRPPNSSLVQFNLELENLLAKYTNENVCIAGDFNVDLINPDNNEFNCIANFISHSYKSHICIPTRVTDLSSTCLDHIWTNLDNVELSGVISDVNITDHFPCF